MSTFLIRCVVWALLAWSAAQVPSVQHGVARFATEWRQAWTVDAPAGYLGLLFRPIAVED